jgi:uncharacterized protein YdeI (YjbR/CyaY-like superfamily)
MIEAIEDYFVKGCGRCPRFATADCSVQRWTAGLNVLRRICLGLGLTETVKWGHPVYMHAGRNIAILGAFREDFRLSFFNAGLMTDPEGVLVKAGPNTREAGVLRFTEAGAPERMAPVVRAYLEEAMRYAAEGRLPAKAPNDLELPEELVEALDADPDLAEAFHALTPGRQRSYVINLNGAKTSATRQARIARFRARIIAGKGATER